ncbi:methyltransferase [Streptomyces sp. NBC_01390]|uniref:methyltransferase n=1 Tax=Streptomyces sp. NBC_01390 TaxID=2903850 RepID=UPI00324F0D03
MKTYPDQPFPGPSPKEVALFSPAADYAHYRPGLPDKVVRLPAGTLGRRPAPTLPDVGTSSRNVSLALLGAVPGLAPIEAVEVSRPMHDQARAVFTSALGHGTFTLVHSTADVSAPLPGEAVPTPDLATGCPSYPWMSGPHVPAMADRGAAPDATTATMGDVSPWTYQAGRTRPLGKPVQRCLGPRRREVDQDDFPEPRRSFEESLAASAWNDTTHRRFPVPPIRTPAGVLGFLRTTSFAGPDLFAERHSALEADARALLDARAGKGPLVEDAVFTFQPARRPGGAS